MAVVLTRAYNSATAHSMGLWPSLTLTRDVIVTCDVAGGACESSSERSRESGVPSDLESLASEVVLVLVVPWVLC